MGQKRRKKRAAGLVQPASSRAASTTPAAPRRHVASIYPVAWLSAGIAALIAIVFAQVRRFDFVFLDDPVYVVENSHVLKGLSWENVRWALTTGAAGNWHPLTWLSHMLDIDMYGLSAGGHHVTNVIFHALTSVLLFVALYRMTSELGKSAFVAALFAIHPLHVESVAWISERKDVLSAFFWMLTILAYAAYVRKPGAARRATVVLLFALGLMSKPMLVTLPFTLLLFDYWPLGRASLEPVMQRMTWLALVREKILLFVLSVVSIVVTVKVQSSYGAVVELGQLPFTARLGNALVSYVAYLRDMIFPNKLAAFYPFHPQDFATISAAALILISVTYIVVRQSKNRPYLIVGWAWYVGTLVPTIGLIQVGDQARADRYTYIPAIGLFIIVAWGISEIAAHLRIGRIPLQVVANVAIAGFTAMSIRQTSYWKNNLSLFSHTAAVTTGNYRAEALLGVALSDSAHYDDAIRHYRTSLSIWPGNAEVHSNLGAALVDLGKTDEALQEFAEAVRYKPGSAIFHYNLGVVLNQKGRTSEAIHAVGEAVRLDPGNKQYTDALTELTRRK